jgi:DNA-binding transcriptional MerR regulator
MTIDELARRAGASTRTVRLYQTKSLLPPPRIVGRVGYYSELHVTRLRLIERLQRRGFSLAGIAELLRMWQEGKSIDELLGAEAALMAPWNEEQPERISAESFATRFPMLAERSDLQDRASALGVMRQEPDGDYTLVMPTLLTFGDELVRRGIPVEVAVEQLELLKEDSRRIAERFWRLFSAHLLPGVVSGSPAELISRLATSSTRLRPAVRALVLTTFMSAMDDVIREFQVAASREKDDPDCSEDSAPQDGDEIAADGFERDHG